MKLLRSIIILIVVAVAYDANAQSDWQSSEHLKNPVLAEYALFNTNTSAQSATQFDNAFFAIEEKKEVGKKSGVIAAGLSLIVPGLGEYYVGGDKWWRGTIFTALEGIGWYGNLRWTSRGDDSTIAFHAFADSLWTPERYSNYLNELYDASGGKKLVTDPGDFSQINRAEDVLDSLGRPNFTHRLPSKGSQQYYELISKYIQFTAGWRDDVDHIPDHSPSVRRHAEMRENMNAQYEVADYFLYGIIINHILSAVDAALLAKDHNKAITLQGELIRKPYPDGTLGYVPTARVEYRF